MGDFYAKAFQELTAAQIYEILKSRSKIFMLEQGIRCLDMDDVDYQSVHCFIEDSGSVQAYLRAFYNDQDKRIVQLGRVLSIKHGVGLGTKLMSESLDFIEKNMPCKSIELHSQAYICGFYEKFGFQISSEPFLEEGIVHITMKKEL